MIVLVSLISIKIAYLVNKTIFNFTRVLTNLCEGARGTECCNNHQTFGVYGHNLMQRGAKRLKALILEVMGGLMWNNKKITSMIKLNDMDQLCLGKLYDGIDSTKEK